MGSSSSAPRKVTIENPNPVNISITPEVLARLQEDGDNPKKNSPPPQPTPSNVDDSSCDIKYITSQQVRRELNSEIEKNNAYWESRMKVYQDKHRQISHDLATEYNKAVVEVNQTLGKHLSSNTSDIEACKECRNNVTNCYAEQKGKPLLCSKEVQKFNSCVANSMNAMLKTQHL